MNADGDDADGFDDEDGVIIPILKTGQDATIIVKARTTAGEMSFNAWIDFNADGDWDELGERIFENHMLGNGDHALTFPVPDGAVLGTTYARFRYSADAALANYWGGGAHGEVEVYLVLIGENYDFGDAPSIYPTYHVDGGAYHLLGKIRLGDLADTEVDGQPHMDALGDNNADQNDEDGVQFLSDLIPGGTANINVSVLQAIAPAKNASSLLNAPVGLFLNAWADFNADGIWGGCGEKIFNDEPVAAGANALSFNVPIWAKTGPIYFRFRLCAMPDGLAGGNTPTGFAKDGEVEDYVVVIDTAGGPQGIGAIKWYQPPLKNPGSHYPHSYWGWDELSVYSEPIIADDWFCADPRPVTGVRWWGSYADWDSVVPPPNAPKSFHVAIWTDIPNRMDRGTTDPGTVVWQRTVDRSQLNEQCVGSDFFFDYAAMSEPDSCFQYDLGIPEEDWFHQENDSTYYWLSIAAIYEVGTPYSHVWGWKTRDRYFRSDGLRILAPVTPSLDSLYRAGEVVRPGWDMSFILFTTIYGEPFDYGDAEDPDYPTLFASNGAHHMLWPGIYMGSVYDGEPDGLPDADALSDDTQAADDEDGIAFNSDIMAGEVAYITVTASVQGMINAWVDYNADGDWDDPGEHVLIDFPVYSGNNNLAFGVPMSAAATTTTARFRYSPVIPRVTTKGLVIGGEVEDYTITISPATDVEDETEGTGLPRKFDLLQNYPNPFNPETTIKFQLPQAGEVIVTIYDVYGREVKTLVRGQWASGVHSVIWDGTDHHGQGVASGMYFYHIAVRTLVGEKKTYNAVKKMIFMK
jgi:hypothetical protein